MDPGLGTDLTTPELGDDGPDSAETGGNHRHKIN